MYPMTTDRTPVSRSVDPAKTATYSAFSKPIYNKGYRGFKLTVGTITGVGTVTASVKEYDASGNVIKTWATGALGAGATAILEVYPGFNTAGLVYNDVLGHLYNSTMTLSPGASLTFDCVLDLIP